MTTALNETQMADHPYRSTLGSGGRGEAHGAERVAYLDQACARQPQLRADGEGLLAVHERLPAGGATTTDKIHA